MGYKLLILILAIGTACERPGGNDDKTSQEIEFTLTANHEQIEDPKLEIVAIYDSLDTVAFYSIDQTIRLPVYDSEMTFFSVRYIHYKSEFFGDFLKYELPTINDSTIKAWHIDIDNPPFEENYKDSSLIYVFRISTDENKTNQVLTYGRD